MNAQRFRRGNREVRINKATAEHVRSILKRVIDDNSEDQLRLSRFAVQVIYELLELIPNESEAVK